MKLRNSIPAISMKQLQRTVVFMKKYEPTQKALAIIRERIAEKIAMKPDWYRYYGVPGGKLDHLA